MKRVMVFGVFDLLHPGHISFLKQAKKLGNFLIVSVARDVNVKKLKGKLPIFDEKKRMKHVKDLKVANKIVLGALKDPWPHILKEKPNVIALGYDQQDYVGNLQQELQKRGLRARVIRLKAFRPDVFKSSKIRKNMLDEKIRGIVKQHMGRGTRLGFPTANLDIIRDVAEGVYLAMTDIDGLEYPSLAFSGPAKTFGETEKLFEVYILDWEKDLYGKEIAVDIIKRLRDVQKFDSKEDLIAQMKRDEEAAREYFDHK
ncbi:MAG: adenylyltransferase/cytidyltransferase family protein [Candidatus Doudnabacteria bacterium]|nr:adenylyltransferase/cytidyltransferase family protein [Candidatus Doudnabacteria bacterium]